MQEKCRGSLCGVGFAHESYTLSGKQLVNGRPGHGLADQRIVDVYLLGLHSLCFLPLSLLGLTGSADWDAT
jgi:hypothetical protein